MILKIDCEYFSGDRPCRFHKESEIKCDGCSKYHPREKILYRFFRRAIEVDETGNHTTILIIKLGAPGDVLRTTPLLNALKREYKNSTITWITAKPSLDLLQGNQFIDEIIVKDKNLWQKIKNKDFDLIINPENTVESALIAERASGLIKLGFGLNERGFIYPFNEEAEYYLEMAGFDDVKRANRKTYQELLFEMCGFNYNAEIDRMVLPQTEERKEIKPGSDLPSPIIGFHTGAGKRWELKKWREKGFVELAERLAEKIGAGIVLLGGELERSRNRRILMKLKKHGVKVLNINTAGDLSSFISALNLCDFVVCGDTLALHLALALKKKVVVLFGPTSPWEIELYGQGVKIVPEMNCISCYRDRCDKKPNCMDLISVDMVYEGVVRLM